MVRKRSTVRVLLMVWAVVVVWLAEPVQACAVCYGNPDADMVKGANAGIVVMLFIAYGVLTSVLGVAGVWFVRARKAARGPGQAESNPAAAEEA